MYGAILLTVQVFDTHLATIDRKRGPRSQKWLCNPTILYLETQPPRGDLTAALRQCQLMPRWSQEMEPGDGIHRCYLVTAMPLVPFRGATSQKYYAYACVQFSLRSLGLVALVTLLCYRGTISTPQCQSLKANYGFPNLGFGCEGEP